MSSDAASSPPPSLPLESALHASLSDGEAPDTQSLEALREQLRCMQLRLAESECCASNLSSELGARDDNYSVTLARLQNEHVYALQTLESSLRAEVRAAAPLNRTRSAPLTSVVGVQPPVTFSLWLWLQPPAARHAYARATRRAPPLSDG